MVPEADGMLRARPASQFGLHLLTTTHVLVLSMLWVYCIALYDMLSSEYCRSRELCGQAPDGFPLKKKKKIVWNGWSLVLLECPIQFPLIQCLVHCCFMCCVFVTLFFIVMTL